jgi:SAM-dependent methyltransferase
MDDAACNLCGGASAELIYREPHGYIPGAEYWLMRCRGCGLIYSHPPLAYDYSGSPLPEGVENLGWEDLLRTKKGRLFRRNLRLMGRYTHVGRLLEVGFGAGTFAALAASQGWDYCGVDINAACTRFLKSRGFANVYHGELEAGLFPPAHFDAVACWQTLEHITDPMAVLEEMNRLLRPGGVLALSLPGATYIRFKTGMVKRFRPRGGGLPHTHLYYFSRDTARKYLERAGFRVMKTAPLPSQCSLFLRLELRRVKLVEKLTALWNAFTALLYFFTGKQLMLATSFVIIAQKRKT